MTSQSAENGAQLYPLDVVRARLGNIGKSTLFELLRTGELGSVKVGARRFVTEAQLSAFIGSLEQNGQ